MFSHNIQEHLDWIAAVAAGLLTALFTEAVFRHYLWVKSGELSADFTGSLRFTHAQHGGRFSAQDIHNGIKSSAFFSRGAAAGCSRRKQEATYWLRTGDHVYSNPNPGVCPITKISLDIFVCVFYVYGIIFSLGDICFHFCICRMLEASSTPPLLHSESSGDPLLNSDIDFSWISTDLILGGQAESSQKLRCVSLWYLQMRVLWRKWGGTAEFSACLKAAWVSPVACNQYSECYTFKATPVGFDLSTPTTFTMPSDCFNAILSSDIS